MSVVAARAYGDGTAVRDIAIDDTNALQTADFVWITLHDPTDAEMESVARTYRLHPLAIEDARDLKHLPKIEAYHEHMFVIVRSASFRSDRLKMRNMSFFVGKKFLITIRHGETHHVGKVRERLEQQPRKLAEGPGRVLHAILDAAVDDYMDAVDKAEKRVLKMEERALDAFLSRAETIEIFRLRREMFKFQRLLGQMEDVTKHLATIECPQVAAQTQPYFRDILDHVRRCEFRVGGLVVLLGSVLDTSNLFEQQRQGIVNRQLAAWAAILAVPTMIAGIYGMNFRYMPELEWRYGYPLVIAVCLSIAGGLYWRFRRLGWL